MTKFWLTVLFCFLSSLVNSDCLADLDIFEWKDEGNGVYSGNLTFEVGFVGKNGGNFEWFGRLYNGIFPPPIMYLKPSMTYELTIHNLLGPDIIVPAPTLNQFHVL